MIYEKIFKLQNEIGAIAKTETNPFYKSKYFSINGLLEQLQPLLEKHGLVVMQPMSYLNDRPAIETLVIDKDDGSVERSVTYLPDIADPQKMGSALTYYRRYALQSLFLLSAEDDDANTVSVKTATKSTCEKCKKEFVPKPSFAKICDNCKAPF
jgi:hypothetical protein